MSQIDKTKKAIGINKIEEKDRQEIFKKFIDAGGQVIKEDSSKKEDPKSPSKSGKSSPSKSPIARDRKNRPQTSDPKNLKGASTEANKNEATPSTETNIHENNYSSFLSIFFLKFKSWSAKVSEFNSPVITPDFLSQLNLELKESLLNLNIANLC